MNIEEQVLSAKNDKKEQSRIVEEYKGFILSCAYKTAKHPVSESDDEFSIAMEAFIDALSHYKSFGGSFLKFAADVIHNRIIDYYRKESRGKTLPFSVLTLHGSDGSETEVDFADTKASSFSDISLEIQGVSEELKLLGISFFDVAKDCPKSKTTKAACLRAAKYILTSRKFTDQVKLSGRLPFSEICLNAEVNRKIPERHRKYIIAAVIIFDGGYDMMKEYFKLAGGENK
ncbi:MAG: sigma factor [Bacillota bacterium]|nr:sigma factor [Bacillota bacterium]